MGARVLVAVVMLGVLAGCAKGPLAEDSAATEAAARQAERLNTQLGYRNRARDAESIAAEVRTVATRADSVQVTPLAWAGRLLRDERATVDVRFDVTVLDAAPFGTTERSATRCYRYELQLYRYTTFHEIDCPAIATPPVPSAAPVPQLPRDAEERLTAALRGATPDTLASAVRAAFPDEVFKVDTVTAQGTLVAAVGVPAERDCIVMIRTADGATKRVGFDPIWLEPGELGCSVQLYTNPPR
ncbi:hypothetical protein KZZ52_24505 [Dactylosporangium sp. AC04546]|uniref:hypothetical protein n=1 Tax=Dactylosporangium sp. AC04546 TaxID=2862460 RepID=UPI001EDD807E|nr:hypothetical protein [Dactylosporangium sp. AC04546]WVK88437.1 hypothetical protein KZZ52_24505 [Dactylosporangium sp. AC04546]